MLDFICRPAARLAHAHFGLSARLAHARFRVLPLPARVRFLLLAVPWAWIGMLSAPVAYAAEAAPAEMATVPIFKGYQNWRDEPLIDWREANARVGEIGGWRTYLRESQEGGGAAASEKPSDKPSGNHSQHGQ